VPEQAIILLAEDMDDDVVLIRKAFAKAHINNPLHVVCNGDEAICYLKGDGPYANRAEYPLPDLLLLDLKMPCRDGFEVLTWIRQQPSLSALRVVVLTSSEDIRDVNMAYRLGANSFLVKPMDFHDFVYLGKYLTSYWLALDKTPQISRPAAEPSAAQILAQPLSVPQADPTVPNLGSGIKAP